MITLGGGDGRLWEWVGVRAWGWTAFLDTYYFLFMFCVFVTFFFFFKLSLQQNVWPKQLKE